MKHFLFSLSFLFFFGTMLPIPVHAEDLIPYSDGKGKWGYCGKDAKIKIKPQFKVAAPFKNGMAAAMKPPYTVFISTSGAEIFRGRWQSVYYPGEQGISMQLRGKWGYMSREGKTMFPAEYDAFYDFPGNDGILAPAQKDGQWGFVNRETKEFMPCGCDEILPFSEGYAVFQRDGKFGLFDKKGREASAPAYEELYPFSQGFATARLNGKYGFLTDSLFFKERNFIRIWPYSDGMAAATSLDSENKCGYIDNEGNVKIPFEYSECQPFSEGMAAVRQSKDGKWGYINAEGQPLTQFRYDKAAMFMNGAAWTVIGKKGIWINQEGRPYDKFFNLKKIQDGR